MSEKEPKQSEEKRQTHKYLIGYYKQGFFDSYLVGHELIEARTLAFALERASNTLQFFSLKRAEERIKGFKTYSTQTTKGWFIKEVHQVNDDAKPQDFYNKQMWLVELEEKHRHEEAMAKAGKPADEKEKGK